MTAGTELQLAVKPDMKIRKTSADRHARLVTDLSLLFFDHLQPLHRMGNTERIWLMHAAYLHDIGKYIRRRDHHKLSRDLIIHSGLLDCSREQKVLIGLIARYHRGPWPAVNHKYYGILDAETKSYINRLSAILRLADALVKGDQSVVTDLNCSITSRHVDIVLNLIRPNLNLRKLLDSAELLGSVLKRKVELTIHSNG